MNPDTSRWRFEEGGEPLAAVYAFWQWMEGLPWFLEVGEELTSAASWPNWREQATPTAVHQMRSDLAHVSSLVRYPADDMAYVLAPVLHPDQDEAVLITEPTPMYTYFFTLLFEEGKWKVHSIGPMVDPEVVGKVAYSW